MSTWADAIAAVHTQLAPLATPTTVAVYDHEPGNNPGFRRPLAVTCSFGPLTPTDYGVMVRVYCSTNAQLDDAQTAFTDLVVAVDEALGGMTPRTVWQTVWLADENAWVCSTVVAVPREDF